MATQTKKTKQFILNNGISQHLLTLPEEGLLVRLKVEGERLSASFEEGAGRMSLQIITWALERLQVDPILDKANPFAVYNPGVFVARRSPEAVDTEDNDGQRATL